MSAPKKPRIDKLAPGPGFTFEALRQIRRHLLRLLHAQICTMEKDECSHFGCCNVKYVLRHMDSCDIKDTACGFTLCASYRKIMTHWHECLEQNCPVCTPVRKRIPGSIKNAFIQWPIEWSPVWSATEAHIERLIDGSAGPDLINGILMPEGISDSSDTRSSHSMENWMHPPEEKNKNSDDSWVEIPENPLQNLWHPTFQRYHDMAKETGFQDSEQKNLNCVLKTLRDLGIYDTILGQYSHYGRNLKRHLTFTLICYNSYRQGIEAYTGNGTQTTQCTHEICSFMINQMSHFDTCEDRKTCANQACPPLCALIDHWKLCIMNQECPVCSDLYD